MMKTLLIEHRQPGRIGLVEQVEVGDDEESTRAMLELGWARVSGLSSTTPRLVELLQELKRGTAQPDGLRDKNDHSTPALIGTSTHADPKDNGHASAEVGEAAPLAENFRTPGTHKTNGHPLEPPIFGDPVGTLGHYNRRHPDLEQRVEINEATDGACQCWDSDCTGHDHQCDQSLAREFKLSGWPDSLQLCRECMPKRAEKTNGHAVPKETKAVLEDDHYDTSDWSVPCAPGKLPGRPGDRLFSEALAALLPTLKGEHRNGTNAHGLRQFDAMVKLLDERFGRTW